MRPKVKPKFTVISEPSKGEEAQNSNDRLRAILDDMALRTRETGLTEERVIELLRNDR